MSMMWKYQPPSPITRPMPTGVAPGPKTWTANHAPSIPAVACSRVFADSPARSRSIM